jgi:2-C-methyl-D-erythritol 2,4-cyclodiphosphate synthase
MDFRIGFGYDVHKLEKGRRFVLGGTEIKYDKGPVAHSDGDVLIHAVCDALLGALALGDIGKHFPDNAEEFKNINSRKLLRKTIQIIHEHGYIVSNIDSTVCLQTPKIGEYTTEIKQILAKDTNIEPDRVSVKATTTEKLGFIGKGKGISAYAVVLLMKKS